MITIYVITNDVNDLKYVGQTSLSIEKRFKQHIRDSHNPRYSKRPMYQDFNKYGSEKFHITALEQCEKTEALDKEKYWIEKLDTFRHGYNNTMGGTGKRYVDYDLILKLWNEGKLTAKDIGRRTGYCHQTVLEVLHNNNISATQIKIRQYNKFGNSVAQIDPETNEIIRIFESEAKACRFINKPRSSHISEVCKGERKTAYGFKWAYV